MVEIRHMNMTRHAQQATYVWVYIIHFIVKSLITVHVMLS